MRHPSDDAFVEINSMVGLFFCGTSNNNAGYYMTPPDEMTTGSTHQTHIVTIISKSRTDGSVCIQCFLFVHDIVIIFLCTISARLSSLPPLLLYHVVPVVVTQSGVT